MRRFALASTLAVASTAVIAQEGRLPRAADVIRDPRGQVGKQVWIEAAGCVDPGAAGFICARMVNGQMLLLKASFLGPLTKLEIAEQLIGRCKGTANIDAPACRMTVLLTVTAVEKEMVDTDRGSVQRVTLHGSKIELSIPSR